jgi:hypothetical protein
MRARHFLSAGLVLVCLATIALALTPTAIYHKKKHYTKPPQDNEEFQGKYVITSIDRRVGQLNATLQY